MEISAVFGVDPVENVLERPTLGKIRRSHFRDEHSSNNCVLIAHVRARKITVAFFVAYYETLALAFFFEFFDDFADVLKTGEHLAHFRAVAFRNSRSEVGGYYGLYRNGFFGQTFRMRKNEIDEQNAHFVARYEPVSVFRLDRRAYSVSIGVGAYHYVRAAALCKLQREVERLGFFGIGVRASSETAVGPRLLGNYRYVVESALAQHLRHYVATRSVERRVHYGQLALIRHGTFVHAIEILARDVRHRYATFLDGGCIVDRFYVERFDALYVIEYFARGFIRDLTAVRSVHLVAVELCGVMARRYHYARVAAEMPNHKRQIRRGFEFARYIRLYAVMREHSRGMPRKLLRELTRIVAYRHRGLFYVREQVVGKSLRDLAYRVIIESVRARAEYAAQARRAELEVFVKRFLNIVRAHRGELCGKTLGFRLPFVVPLFDFVHDPSLKHGSFRDRF